jgi:hypothetical protein
MADAANPPVDLSRLHPEFLQLSSIELTCMANMFSRKLATIVLKPEEAAALITSASLSTVL